MGACSSKELEETEESDREGATKIDFKIAKEFNISVTETQLTRVSSSLVATLRENHVLANWKSDARIREKCVLSLLPLLVCKLSSSVY